MKGSRFTALVTGSILGGILIATSLAGCGGGGGGDGVDFVGGATVAIRATPTEIDTGDRIKVMIPMADIYDDGILLKVRFPVALRFVNGSGKLMVDGKSTAVTPLTVATSVQDESTYVVFAIQPNTLGQLRVAELNFEVEGVAENDEASIEVDADVNDPAVPDSEEFQIQNPEFSAVEQVDIKVRGES